MTYETGQQLYHRVELEGRDKLTVSGVEDVERFDEGCIVMSTCEGTLIVTGQGLHIGKLSLDGGELHVDGRIEALTYEEQQAPRGSWLTRLLGGRRGHGKLRHGPAVRPGRGGGPGRCRGAGIRSAAGAAAQKAGADPRRRRAVRPAVPAGDPVGADPGRRRGASAVYAAGRRGGHGPVSAAGGAGAAASVGVLGRCGRGAGAAAAHPGPGSGPVRKKIAAKSKKRLPFCEKVRYTKYI